MLCTELRILVTESSICDAMFKILPVTRSKLASEGPLVDASLKVSCCEHIGQGNS